METEKNEKLTVAEIIAIIENAGISVHEFAHCDYDDELKPLLGEIIEVEQHGGEEQGSDWYSVKHFPKHGVYIKTSGYYSSYNGTDFDDGYGEEVKPTEKTITVYV